MKVRLKDGLLIVSAESDEERTSMAGWVAPVDGHVFRLVRQDAQTLRLASLGRQEDACREPINVTSRATDTSIQLISNFARTPFSLDGRGYASVEAFWQGLKFPEDSRRLAIASLSGQDARLARNGAPDSTVVEYGGRQVVVGTWDHWQLMLRACRAKFTQHADARRALLSTGDRPLMHRTRKDSRTIPGVVMADIWMRVRRELLKGSTVEAADDPTADD
jgi:predicted NAD-dependent protein-ADP-ribosyltransferase YbiA (DUF1768 family)